MIRLNLGLTMKICMTQKLQGSQLEALEKYSFPNKHKDIEEGLSDLQFSSSLNAGEDMLGWNCSNHFATMRPLIEAEKLLCPREQWGKMKRACWVSDACFELL